MLLRTGTTGHGLQEKFPDTRLESSNHDRLDRGRQVLDEHSVISSSPFTHRRPFILLFVLGRKEQSVSPSFWHVDAQGMLI